MDFEKSITRTNLARAFAGECQAGARYQFLAKKAEGEGFKYISILMKTIAKNEMNHAKAYYDLIINNSKEPPQNIEITGGFPFEDGTVEVCLKEAMENEEMEADSIYPSFGKIAKDEGFLDVAKMFEMVSSVETCHALLLKQLYEKMKMKKLYKSPEAIKWKCGECGYERTTKQPWNICPLCKKPQGHTQIPLDMGQ